MGRRDLTRFIGRFTNTALFATPAAAASLYDLSVAALSSAVESSGRASAPAYTVVEGVALVPIFGELTNHSSSFDEAWGLISYDQIQGTLRQARRDMAVRSIVLLMDSPGGEMAGATETASVVREVAAVKPVVSFVNSLAASAAYAIAAASTEIITTPSATLGSIGCVWLHLDKSKALADAGFKPTLLSAGQFKTDGNSLETLGPNARGRIQDLLDGAYELLLTSVGGHRPALGVAGARATEAGLFMGQGAVDARLADRVGDQTVALGRARALAATLRPNGPMVSAVVSGVQNEKGYAEGYAEGLKLAHAETVMLERKRFAAILLSPEAKTRYDLARYFAAQTDLTAPQAIGALAAAPEVKPLPLRRDLGASVPRPMLGPGMAESEPATEYEAGRMAAVHVLAAAGRLPRPWPPRPPTQTPAGPSRRDHRA